MAVSGGILIDHWRPVPLGWSSGLALVCLSAACAPFLRPALVRGPLPSVLLLLACGALSAAWHHFRWHLMPADHVVRWLPADGTGTIVQLRGTATSSVRNTVDAAVSLTRGLPDSQRFQFGLQVSHIRQGSDWSLASGYVLVRGRGRVAALQAGDAIHLTGELLPLAAPQNPGQVDFRPHYRARGIRCVVRLPTPSCLRVQPVGWQAHALMALWRSRWNHVLERQLPRSSYPLASELLLGDRAELTGAQRDAFLLTGTTHLLAISGMHVGILAAGWLWGARRRLVPFRLALLCVMVAMTAYAQLAEARAPVVRASVSIQLLCLAWLTRRRGSLANVLGVAGIIVLLLCPADLFSVGTQLSFLAVASLGRTWVPRWHRPPEDALNRLIWRTRPWYWRWLRHWALIGRQMLWSGLCVWLVTAPLVLFRFHLIAPMSIPLSLLLWPPLALALISGFTLIIMTELYLPGTALMATVCHASISVLEATVQHVADWPECYRWTVAPAGHYVVACYLLILLGWLVLRPRIRFVCYGAAAVCVVWGWLQPQWDRYQRLPSLRCTFLSVGHGACVVLQLPDGQVWLYDAGRMGNARPGVDWVSRYLWRQGIRRIDRVLLSHVDLDHYNLLPELCRRFAPRELLVTRGANRDSQHVLRWLRGQFHQLGVPLRYVGAPCCWFSQGCQLTVWHPAWGVSELTDNGNSLILAIRYREHSILLTGDLEGSAFEHLIERGRLHVDVAMAPHHGSLQSDPSGFAHWCTPDWLIVSGGDAQGMPPYRDRLPAAGTTLLHTAVHGAVEVDIDARGLRVTPFYRHESPADPPRG
jgi:competence protein ComEC